MYPYVFVSGLGSYDIIYIIIIAGLGYCMILVSGMACIYYNAVLSWIIYYLYSSFTRTLPWASCDHWWNTPTCIDPKQISAPSGGNDSAPFGNCSASVASGLLCDGSDILGVNQSWLNVSVIMNNSSNTSEVTVYADGLAPKSAAEEFWQ